MTTTDTTPDWQLAGEAWSHAATDWAYGFEPYARDGIETVLAKTAVGPGTDVLDVACGAGLALARAERLGASVSGLDAAAGLLEIAARRAPGANLVHGTMFDLPWDDDSFDVVLAFNGIWGGCDEAVAELGRVCRPSGRVGLTFWGASDRMDLLGYFVTVGQTGPGVTEEIISLAAINAPGEAERVLTDAGFVDIERGVTEAILEFTDDDHAWRVLRSPGLVVPSLRHTGEDELRAQVLESIAAFRADDGSYRLTNELVHVTATMAG
ncbi:MAG: class I SAM-dependent methyltransferase [Acidimicrobiales bacterium]|nr:class I SAM-dependent methyltransferase [Acidimicrobiales bacterium]